MLLNFNTGDGKTLPIEIAECGGASQKAGNPPAKFRNPGHRQHSTLEDFGYLNRTMRSHTRVGCLDHRECLFQVVTGPGLKCAPALQAIDEVELCGTNAVSTVSDAGIAPDSLASGPDLAQPVDTDRSCVSLERSLVKGRPAVFVLHKAV